MTLRSLRVGSIDGWQLYDDADFDEGIYCEGPVKAGTPVASNDVLRMEDIGSGGIIDAITGPTISLANSIARFSDASGSVLDDTLVTIDNSGNITVPNGVRIGQVSGPKITFDDTNNFLEISDCDVGIGLTTPLGKLHVRDGANFNFVMLQYSTYMALSAENDSGTPRDMMISANDLYFTSGSIGLNVAPDISSGEGIHIAGSTIRIASGRTPASAGAAGNAGEVCFDSNYIYRCISTNTWVRGPIATW